MTSTSKSSTQQPPSSTFRLPRGKGLNRPATWFGAQSFGKSSTSSTSSSASNSSDGPSASIAQRMDGVKQSPVPNPFTVSSFKSPFPSSKGKHKLSPSPSPSPRKQDEDFVMISPVGHGSSPLANAGTSSTPENDSPTPACGMASAAARLRLVDDSPIRRVPGQSRSLRPGADGQSSMSPLKNPVGMSDEEEEEEFLQDEAPTPMMGESPAPPPRPVFTVRQSKSSDSSSSSSGGLFGDASKIPTLSKSHPLRRRAGTATSQDRPATLGQKKTISLDQIHRSASGDDAEALFGSNSQINSHVRKARPSSTFAISSDGRPPPPGTRPASSTEHRAHKRINSSDRVGLTHMRANSAGGSSTASISRSFGAKSLSLSLAPNLGNLPDFSHSNGSISSLSTNNLTPPATFSPTQPPIFEGVKPLQEVFQEEKTVSRKFKPRDSGVSMGSVEEELPSQPRSLIPPPSVMKLAPSRLRRPAMLKRTSSMGDEKAVETPGVAPMLASGWPGKPAPFEFLGDSGIGLGIGANQADAKPSMPGTPVKKQAYKSNGVGHSVSQPTLGSDSFDCEMTAPLENSSKPNLPPNFAKPRNTMPPPSTQKPPPSMMKRRPGTSELPRLTLTQANSSSPMATEDEQSPTVRAHGSLKGISQMRNLSLVNSREKGSKGKDRLGVLGRSEGGVSESEEEDGTPTKSGDSKMALAANRKNLMTPTPSAKTSIRAAPPSAYSNTATTGTNLMPRLSLPALPPKKMAPSRTLHHRQSHPATNQPEEEDLFEAKFITLDILGKGAFSTVVKVQERNGEGIWAVKKARGMFDGVRDRLRHLEEVDILRHLSLKPSPHVILFQDAWEQNRQLFIQTELCLGSLAFFLEEYGRVVERLDEGRVWKCVRELSDGINHIHSNGVIHFDIKPANVLISATGSLKIGDFGLATRWPRVEPLEILKGAGLGMGSGNMAVLSTMRKEKLEREGDRVYMAPEMLRGFFVMAADIFSFGLVVLEIATNICVPDGGAPWHALRENDFSVVDLSPLSPALCELICQCMSAQPELRPEITHIVSHPVVQRARKGKDALAPEDKNWLMEVLAGGFSTPNVPAAAAGDEDVVME
ncbi:hypothetical protein L202_04674 [Cryptococcus amylolentus CBS 6039]|uniref:Protein kinase domain-containing protein n=2 Tax=Cryptococcus amylolentus TaxID=104669 RepID=A0A1E3HMC2_9TREE|nr:hypothetical protein L202_04674 [Cryptococcus amylolentus CBS 6039]ODN77503.1 hypothetical protein L202_04674 [Cryptococcus amylolentus CBS 6039]ODO05549.1 hypothetical protein I350_04600 [Cryptococcus amylolentus CBS 6273]